MGTFGILNDYKTLDSGIAVRTHAIMLVREHSEPIIAPFSYNITRPEKTPYEDLKNFLEKNVPAKAKGQGYDVYVCETYFYKHLPMLRELKHRFNAINMGEAAYLSEEMQAKILASFQQLSQTLNVDSHNCIEAIVKQSQK